jgi:hypothetical protein
MSTVPTPRKLPKATLAGLRDVAVPKKRLFRRPIDNFEQYMATHGRALFDVDQSGYVMAVAISYLDERHGIDLTDPEFEPLCRFLVEARQSTFLILTKLHKDKYLSMLSREFSQQELRSYYDDFLEVQEPESGQAMRESIDVLRRCLLEADEHSVILLSLG